MTESGHTDQKSDKKSDQKSDNKTAKNNAQTGSSRAGRNTAKPGKEKPARRGGAGVILLALFAILVGLAAGVGAGAVWYWGQMELAGLDQRIDTVERGLESNVQDLVLPQIESIESTQQQLEQTNSQQSESIAQLQSDSTGTRVQISELSDKVEGSRRRWQLLEIEDLLRAASQRLQLYKDADGALRALELAENRLAELNDPRLFTIREQVIDEIAAVKALPKPDLEGLALALSSLINKVPKLPLETSTASDFEAEQASKADSAELPDKPWKHLLESLRTALDRMLTIRRADTEYKPLMPPDQAFFLYQNLQLKLEAARVALLRKNTALFSDSLTAAQEWLDTWYATGNAGVASAIEQIGQLKKTELAWREPDISGSLRAMREFLETQSGESLRPDNAATEQVDEAPEQAGAAENADAQAGDDSSDGSAGADDVGNETAATTGGE